MAKPLLDHAGGMRASDKSDNAGVGSQRLSDRQEAVAHVRQVGRFSDVQTCFALPSMPWRLPGHLLIACSARLHARLASGEVGSSLIEAAHADVAVGARWPSGYRFAILRAFCIRNDCQHDRDGSDPMYHVRQFAGQGENPSRLTSPTSTCRPNTCTGLPRRQRDRDDNRRDEDRRLRVRHAPSITATSMRAMPVSKA